MLRSRLTFSKYLSRISRPQLAHTFFPVDGTELVVEVGEHTEGVDGVLGDERVSSRSMLDRWDSPSEWDCKRATAQLRHTHRLILIHIVLMSPFFYDVVSGNARKIHEFKNTWHTLYPNCIPLCCGRTRGTWVILRAIGALNDPDIFKT